MAKYLGIPLQVASGTTVTPTYGSPELVGNGDFISTLAPNTVLGAAGTSNITWDSQGGGSAKLIYNSVDNTSLYLDLVGVAIEKGKLYEMSISITDIVAGSLVKIFDGLDNQIKQTIGAGVTTFRFTATSTVSSIRIYRQEAGLDSELYINSVSLKEVSSVLGKEIVSSDYIPANFTTGSGWTLNGSSASRGVVPNSTNYLVPNITSQLVDGKSYQVGFTLSNMSQANNAGISSTGAFGQNGADLKFRDTDGSNLFNSVYDEDQSLSPDLRFVSGTNALTFTVSGITVKEVQYNYLQVAGGDFLKQCKVGDVVFNSTDDNEAVVLQVIDNDTLLLSNDVLSDAGDAFSIFAPNGDTRGNQILRVDNYIISEYDEASSLPDKSSFWFAAGPQADKVTLTQLNDAVNTYFVADVIERFVQRLNAQSATASRLDIPLNEFRDHKYNQVLTTTAITLS